MFKRRAVVISLIILLGAAGIGGYLYWRQYLSATITEFTGTITARQPKELVVDGFYTALDHPELQNLEQKKEVRVRIAPETTITKTVIHLPTIAQIEASGGYYKLEDQPRDTLPGSLDEIGLNDVIIVHTTGNIFHRTSFTATEIEYLVHMYPEE